MALHRIGLNARFPPILGAIACVLILFFVAPPPLAAQDADDTLTPYELRVGWLSRDKAYHFGLSAAGAGGLYALGREVGLGRWSSAVGAGLVMGTIGVLRELHDADDPHLLTTGKFSRRDMVWNGLGIVVGVSVSDIVRRLR
ncbi:MAG: hypothetical protein WD766_15175 [Gemmatimonadota bacterium]